jgi:hypothetical protein
MEIALLIIHNHKFTKNIEIIESVYRERFSNIFHLVPFYEGGKSNVIPVYESSHFFQGYIAQAFRSFFNEKFDHYFFVADDMIVNPVINEKNYGDLLKVNKGEAFIPRLISLNKDCPWPGVGTAYDFNIKAPGVEAANELPTAKKALEQFEKFNLKNSPLRYDQVHGKKELPKGLSPIKEVLGYFYRRFHRALNKNKTFELPYPLVGAYSDIFIVPGTSIKKFIHYAGIFAATALFVEIALPSALVLSSDIIVTEDDTAFNGVALWPEGWLNIQDKDMEVRAKGYSELDNYDYSLKKLLSNFPKTYLYLHPVKLSKWDTTL